MQSFPNKREVLFAFDADTDKVGDSFGIMTMKDSFFQEQLQS